MNPHFRLIACIFLIGGSNLRTILARPAVSFPVKILFLLPFLWIAAHPPKSLASTAQDSNAVQIGFCQGRRIFSLDISIFRSAADPVKGFLLVLVHGSGPLGRKIIPATLRMDREFMEVTPESKGVHPFKVEFGKATPADYLDDRGEFGVEPLSCSANGQ